MSLRQAAARLRRILPHPFQILNHTRLGGNVDSGKIIFSCPGGSGSHTRNRRHQDAFTWIFLSGHAVIFLGLNANPVLAEDVSIDLSTESDTSGESSTGLQKIEDESVVSNVHTSRWRVFTDSGRDFFLQGKLEDAERLFIGALQEATEGFGEMDPHVASACNNLAELYRVKKAFDKAEPLYLRAVNILEESYGPDDIRVGAALHNLGQFYLVQRKLEEARACYERALKIKRRVLGEGHVDYAETMYHLGMVLQLQGKGKDSEALILDSIRILEETGLGESLTCTKRMRRLAQMYINSNQLVDAVNLQRKILHTMEVSKGWNSLDIVIVAEGLALTLQSVGSLTEAQELLERCLDSRKTLLPEYHIQIAANMVHLARVEMLKFNQSRIRSLSEAGAELDKAEDLLGNAIRIAQQSLFNLKKQKGRPESRLARKEELIALAILLQAFNAIGRLETTKLEFQESTKRMSNDRGWMYRRLEDGGLGIRPEFIEGVREFIGFALDHPECMSGDKIRCPCCICLNKKFQTQEILKTHLYKKGFKPRYTIWASQGEKDPSIFRQQSTSSQQLVLPKDEPVVVEEESNPDIDIGPDFKWEEHIPNGEALLYFDLLDTCRKGLTEACKTYAKWSAAQILTHKSEKNDRLSVFTHPERPFGYIGTKYLSDDEVAVASLYVLMNCKEIEPFILEYEKEVIDVMPNIDPQVLSTRLDKEFTGWFAHHVKYSSKPIAENIKRIARGPKNRVHLYNGHYGNGYEFHSKNLQIGSGVCIRGSCYGDDERDYYGVLDEIVELEYESENNKVDTLVLFKCKWYDTIKGIRVHPRYDIFDLNPETQLFTDNPFVLASQAELVHFIGYPGCDKRERTKYWAVCITKARSTNDVSNGVKVDSFQDQEEESSQGSCL